jgi:hypothetical protein
MATVNPDLEVICMFRPSLRPPAIRFGVPLAALALVSALPATTNAATVPQSNTTCWGSLKHDPSGSGSGEPNLLDYSFNCNQDITAYTILVNRQAGHSNVIDDFNPGPVVNQPDGTPSATESFTCAGITPGAGFNCNQPAAGGVMSAWNSAVGSFDPIDPYCGGVPAGSKAGTAAEPRAFVQLVVTNTTGGQDGPFALPIKPGCPKPKPKHKRRHR